MALDQCLFLHGALFLYSSPWLSDNRLLVSAIAHTALKCEPSSVARFLFKSVLHFRNICTPYHSESTKPVFYTKRNRFPRTINRSCCTKTSEMLNDVNMYYKIHKITEHSLQQQSLCVIAWKQSCSNLFQSNFEKYNSVKLQNLQKIKCNTRKFILRF